MNRLYESHEKRGLLVCADNPSTVFSFSPKFKIVSIIPGIEIAAPDLTETKRGLVLEFHFFPVRFSIFAIFFLISGMSDFGNFLLFS